jgi:hypothetical protein
MKAAGWLHRYPPGVSLDGRTNAPGRETTVGRVGFVSRALRRIRRPRDDSWAHQAARPRAAARVAATRGSARCVARARLPCSRRGSPGRRAAAGHGALAMFALRLPRLRVPGWRSPRGVRRGRYHFPRRRGARRVGSVCPTELGRWRRPSLVPVSAAWSPSRRLVAAPTPALPAQARGIVVAPYADLGAARRTSLIGWALRDKLVATRTVTVLKTTGQRAIG